MTKVVLVQLQLPRLNIRVLITFLKYFLCILQDSFLDPPLLLPSGPLTFKDLETFMKSSLRSRFSEQELFPCTRLGIAASDLFDARQMSILRFSRIVPKSSANTLQSTSSEFLGPSSELHTRALGKCSLQDAKGFLHAGVSRPPKRIRTSLVSSTDENKSSDIQAESEPGNHLAHGCMTSEIAERRMRKLGREIRRKKRKLTRFSVCRTIQMSIDPS